MIWYDFGPIRTSGSIVSTLTLHSLTGTLKGPGSFFGGFIGIESGPDALYKMSCLLNSTLVKFTPHQERPPEYLTD